MTDDEHIRRIVTGASPGPRWLGAMRLAAELAAVRVRLAERACVALVDGVTTLAELRASPEFAELRAASVELAIELGVIARLGPLVE